MGLAMSPPHRICRNPARANVKQALPLVGGSATRKPVRANYTDEIVEPCGWHDGRRLNPEVRDVRVYRE